jgi:hypothetical protein
MKKILTNEKGMAMIALAIIVMALALAALAYVLQGTDSASLFAKKQMKKAENLVALEENLKAKTQSLVDCLERSCRPADNTSPDYPSFKCDLNSDASKPEFVVADDDQKNITYTCRVVSEASNPDPDSDQNGFVITGFYSDGQENYTLNAFVPENPVVGQILNVRGTFDKMGAIDCEARNECLRTGTKIYLNDTLTVPAGSSWVQIRMKDDTVMLLGSNTKMNFQEFKFKTNVTRNALYELVYGLARIFVNTTGGVPDVKVKTGLVSMGIRGTEFSIDYSGAVSDSLEAETLTLLTSSGTVQIYDEVMGEIKVLESGDLLTAVRIDRFNVVIKVERKEKEVNDLGTLAVLLGGPTDITPAPDYVTPVEKTVEIVGGIGASNREISRSFKNRLIALIRASYPAKSIPLDIGVIKEAIDQNVKIDSIIMQAAMKDACKEFPAFTDAAIVSVDEAKLKEHYLKEIEEIKKELEENESAIEQTIDEIPASELPMDVVVASDAELSASTTATTDAVTDGVSGDGDKVAAGMIEKEKLCRTCKKQGDCCSLIKKVQRIVSSDAKLGIMSVIRPRRLARYNKCVPLCGQVCYDIYRCPYLK